MIEKLNLNHIKDVVNIHIDSFPESQSTELGRDFLWSYYIGAVESKNLTSFVYVKNNNAVGFIFGGINKRKLSRQILIRSKKLFFKSILRNLMKNPINSFLKFSSYLKHYILPGGDKFYADDTSTLDSVAVLIGNRGEGIADKLMDAFLSELKSNGISACRLGVLAENRIARKFYERSGFEQANEEGSIYIYHFNNKYRNY